MIAVIDYGLGNLGSVANMLRRIGVPGEITRDRKALEQAQGLILPGVGHFDLGMRNLRQLELQPVLDELVLKQKKPILGICLGMQLLARKSEEGTEPGLGWVPADVIKFSFSKDQNLAIPHMGWNNVEVTKGQFLDVDYGETPRFYFVHSYRVVCDNETDVAAWCTYGEKFCAAVQHENVWGTQFHPEKSHKFGMTVLKQFARACGHA